MSISDDEYDLTIEYLREINALESDTMTDKQFENKCKKIKEKYLSEEKKPKVEKKKVIVLKKLKDKIDKTRKFDLREKEEENILKESLNIARQNDLKEEKIKLKEAAKILERENQQKNKEARSKNKNIKK